MRFKAFLYLKVIKISPEGYCDGSVSRQIPAGQTPQPEINWRSHVTTGEIGLHKAVPTPHTYTHMHAHKLI